MYEINDTHDPKRMSWIDSANTTYTDFPIHNLPFCLFDTGSGATIGVGIGDQILNLKQAVKSGLIPEVFAEPASQVTLNAIMATSPSQLSKLRRTISDLLLSDTDTDKESTQAALVPQAAAKLLVPCLIRDYSDFYASVFHATNVGSMFRPDNPLLPNYKHIPIGYHGRASSIVVSGTEIRRPYGQQTPGKDGIIHRAPSKMLDYELEVGFFVGRGNELGTPIKISNAEDHLFGMCLVNDWSARDVQKWEYQPLGPFLAKSFATSISPWVVTMEALAPFRTAEFQRPSDDPKPIKYLSNEENRLRGGVDIKLEVFLATMNMRETKMSPDKLSSTSFTNMYWTIAQMLTHHASNGCNLQPGDLMASGTVSGPDRSERGCLLELTWKGGADNPLPGSDRVPLVLPNGEERKFLADGDEVILRGYCDDGIHRRIGFGECSGIILPAL